MRPHLGVGLLLLTFGLAACGNPYGESDGLPGGGGASTPADRAATELLALDVGPGNPLLPNAPEDLTGPPDQVAAELWNGAIFSLYFGRAPILPGGVDVHAVLLEGGSGLSLEGSEDALRYYPLEARPSDAGGPLRFVLGAPLTIARYLRVSVRGKVSIDAFVTHQGE